MLLHRLHFFFFSNGLTLENHLRTLSEIDTNFNKIFLGKIFVILEDLKKLNLPLL